MRLRTLLTGVLLFALFVYPVSASAKTVTAYTSVENAGVYAEDGSLLGTVGINTKVEVLAVKGDVCKVSRDGRVAYMKKGELTTRVTREDDSGITYITPTVYYITSAKADVYSTAGKKLGTLSKGTAVTVTAYNDAYMLVTANGREGLIRKGELSVTKPEGERRDSDVTYIDAKTYYIVSQSATVYNTKGKKLGTLSKGTAVTVTAYNDTYALITRDGAQGLVCRSDLTEQKPEEEKRDDGVTYIDATTFYVASESAAVYNASSERIGSLPRNTAVTVTAYNDTYVLISVDGRKGLMRRDDVSANRTQEGQQGGVTYIAATRFFVCNDGAKLYDASGNNCGTLKLNTEVTATAYSGDYVLITADGTQALISRDDLSSEKTAVQTTGHSVTPARGRAVEMDWWTSGIQQIFARGTYATVTDVETGLSWEVYRGGGTNHADVQPRTAADTATMLKACGKWSWDRRAIYVTINGVNYAASMNCKPHGSGSIKNNNFNGHHCIHFTNSRTHGTNKVCNLHQSAIKRAASAVL